MNTPRVVVVDDDDVNTELVSFVLQMRNIAVDLVSDASQAMDQISALQPDLILMDVQMSGMDGLELIRQLRTSTPTMHIILVALTDSEGLDQARQQEAGCDGGIAKPINVATFASTVLSFLEIRRP